MNATPTSTDGVFSVVMPCFNEDTTVNEILDRVLDSPLVGEIIAVDDGSTDRTLDILSAYADPRLRVLAQPGNRGKGAALRRGFAEATMPYVIVQDADLEYDPSEYPKMLAPLVADEADVVYGSRFSGGDARRILYFWHTLGNRALTLASNMATNLNLSDMETCYKAFRREIIQSIDIEEDRFGFEPEVTAKIASMRCRVLRGRHQLSRPDLRRRQEDRLARRGPSRVLHRCLLAAGRAARTAARQPVGRTPDRLLTEHSRPARQAGLRATRNTD